MTTLSIQLYSLREHGPLEAQLDLAATAGFRAVETLNSMLENASETRDALDARGLTAPSSHVAIPVLRERLEAVVVAARALGVGTLVIPALHPPLRPTDAEGWRAIGAEMGAIARRLGEDGLGLAFHNHHWEVEPLPGGALPLDLLLEAGAAGGLRWQADLAWLVRGADDPLKRLARWGERLHSVHVKDIAAPGQALDEDGWADPGAGVLDWPTLWAVAARAGADLWIAEHDKPNDPARFVRRAMQTMRDLAAAEAGA
jgi:sugar phosphate isomerase/epimerase